MKKILNRLFNHEHLDEASAKEILIKISKGDFNDSQVTSFITVFLMRSITVDELAGFRSALLDLCIPVDMEERETIDLCGTGGDGKNTFNISTLSSFVVAGAGYLVAKHGNVGVSSACGSSNVLEYFGYKFTNDVDKLRMQIDRANICYLHAPLFHPALKGVGPIRRQLGVKTFFNMLGPLVNPAQPKQQLVGVFNLSLAKLYKYLHERLDKSHMIVHALDGYDEVSLTGKAKLINHSEEIVVGAKYFGMESLDSSEIYGGGNVGESAKIFEKIISGNGSQAQTNVVVANSALGIQCFNPEKSILDCVAEARESITSGKAHLALKTLIQNQ